jgi:seryl-tRNA synthetase
VVLTPAACYPVYPVLAGTLPPGGRLVDVMSSCFRHEPSDDAGRMQMFRMHEHVRAADAASAVAWREVWAGRAERLAATLGFAARRALASDPFFGRGGKLLAVNQRDQRLKIEILAPIASEEQPAAIISLNYHQDHFGHLFGIRTADGAVAHTACVGFGLERIALALYWRHGFDRVRWSPSAREALGL